ncbi:uncharacterized protein [Watersipora subatra]|uniref:uncharacterized protein n=1 Tax=Watersipora subatra TaxID=2589382 RepID=UPI00355B5AEA
MDVVVMVPKVKPQPKSRMQSQQFGTSLISHSSPSRGSSPSSFVSPTPPTRHSPDYDFNIVPRSPSPNTKHESSKTSGRVLDSKVGNDWTFRQRLAIPVVAEKTKEPPVVEKPQLPDVPEKPVTVEPEPQLDAPLIKRRIRRIPKNLAKVTKAFRKKSGPMLTKKELKSVSDPLDYLAKYCLIHPERLPVYERIFKEAVAKQSPRFSDVYCVLDKSSEERPFPIRHVEEPGPPHSSLSDEKKKHLRYVATMTDGSDKVAMNNAEYQVSKLTFTLEQLYTKYNQLLDEYDQMEKTKMQKMSALAKRIFPHVLDSDYVAPTKSKKKRNGKLKSSHVTELPHIASTGSTTSKLSDTVIVSRLNSAERKKINLDDEVYRLQLKLSRLEVKVHSAEVRMDELEAEKQEMQVWSQELYLKECAQSFQEPEFRKKQSTLFNKFHPDMDEQMNIDEVEEALRTINGHLLTDKELQFIYHILKIPGRKVLNLKTFGCVAALSEKVQQLHPVIRKLINKFDFEALDVKMEKCKELYELLQEGTSDKPYGTIPLRSLHVELQAGGLSDEHLNFVTSKFNVTEKGYVEYLDFLTYVPLFVELHDRICSNPLATERVG